MHIRTSGTTALMAVAALLVESAPAEALAAPGARLSLVSAALDDGRPTAIRWPGTGLSAHGRYVVFASAATDRLDDLPLLIGQV